MPRRARIHYVSLRSSLVNLPISIYGPLLERNVRPQHLAIHLKLVSTPQNPNVNVEAYVGWTGMASASSLTHFSSPHTPEKALETIEIDPQFAQGLGLSQGDLVEIGLLHDLPLAQSVATEPLTSDDWEIIEIHASHVESTLLSQVRVAKVGQEIDVWVMGRTRVRLRVGALNLSIHATSNSAGPIHAAVSVDPSSKGSALLLTTNTEVSIAPKLHRSSRRADTSSRQDTPQDVPRVATSKERYKRDSHVLRNLPHGIFNVALPDYSGSELVGFVSPTTYLTLSKSGPPEEAGLLSCSSFNFKRLTPPLEPSSSPQSMPSPPPPVPRVIKPGNDGGLVDNIQVENIVFVGTLAGLPDSHIVFPAAPKEVEDWDLLVLSSDDGREKVNVNRTPTPTSLSSPVPAPILAGVGHILENASNFCLRQFISQAYAKTVHGVSALLLTGRSGTGKTSIVRHVAKTIQEDSSTYSYTFFVDVSRYAELPIATIKLLLQYWFDKAMWHKPSILILDNLDKLVGAELEHADSFRTRHITELFLSIYSSSSRAAAPNTRGIVLLATATSSASLHPLVNASHVFREELKVKPPNNDARKDIIEHIVLGRLATAQDIRLNTESPLNYVALATQTEGYSVTDLQDLVGRAVHQVAIRAATKKQPATLSPADFAAAQVDFTPLSLRDVKLQKSDVGWSDIGGLHETRRILRETLEWPTKYGPIFAQSPLRLRSGLLLYGFPGCGKTLLASAVAKECGLNFISVKGPEILNKYIGASEKSVRDLFERASAAKPCVLFFDEFDSIAPKRGHDSTGVTDRVVNQMLTQMDGAEGLDGVYVLAATSRPDLIDSALLRPGRLDKSLLCRMPDLQERKEILEAVGRRVSVSPSVKWDATAAATEGFSGADLQALVYNAHLEVIHASISHAADKKAADPISVTEDPIEFKMIGGLASSKSYSKAEQSALEKRLRQIKQGSLSKPDLAAITSAARKHEITTEHLQRVLKTMRPSVSSEERRRLDRIYRAFVSDRSGDFTAPPDANAREQPYLSTFIIALGSLTVARLIYQTISVLLQIFVIPGKNLKRFGANKGAWAVVTGASDGIGKEFAFQLAKGGFNVLLVARNKALLQTTASDIAKKYPGVSTEIHSMDFAKNAESDYEQLSAILSDKNVGVLVNNVGKSHVMPAYLVDTPKDEMTDIVAINVNATLRVTYAILPGMVQRYRFQLKSESRSDAMSSRKRGLILNIGSFAGGIPSPMLATYSGTKAFLATFTSALAEEVRAYNITVEHVNTYFVVSKLSKIRKSSALIPQPGPFVRSVLSKIGLACGAAYSGRPGTSTPYWSHALMDYAMTVIGIPSLFISYTHGLHKSIRKRALKKQEREAKRL
ncbi:hypothetical protein DXG01_010098 [Tephrocybe rancida]|nr:hypothetical protein DXG01_010098 [Tephrocybe rancida]